MIFANPVYYLLAYAICNNIKYKIDGHKLIIYHVFDPKSEIFKLARNGLYEYMEMNGKKYYPFTYATHSREKYTAGEYTVIVLPKLEGTWDEVLYKPEKKDNHTWICNVQASSYYDTAGGLIIDRLVTEDELKKILEKEGKPVCKEIEPGIFTCDYAYVNMIHRGNCKDVAVIPYSQMKMASTLRRPVYIVPDPSTFCSESYPSELVTNDFLRLLEVMWDNFSGGGVPVKFVEMPATRGHGAKLLFDRYFGIWYGDRTDMGDLINTVMHTVAKTLNVKLTSFVDYMISETVNAFHIPIYRFSDEQIHSLKDALKDAMSKNVYYLRIPLCTKYEYKNYKLHCVES